jgi:DeoR family transcriptional regulator of aga operon
MTSQRRAQIAGKIREKGAMRVAELAELFKVSEVTIRNDLANLERGGNLVRDHGGAVAVLPSVSVTSLTKLEKRVSLNQEAKSRIGQAAAKLVSAGDTIIIDAGTTAVEMVPHLSGITPLTVVTNALNVALEVAAKTDAQLILLGGTFSRQSMGTVGGIVQESLERLVVHKAFLGTQAFDLEHGLTDSTMEIAQVKRAMVRASRECILLSDASKWAHAGVCKVAPLPAMHKIICDEGLAAGTAESIRQAGINLQLV